MQKESSATESRWEAPVLNGLPATWGRGLTLALEQKILPHYLQFCRWFGGKARQLREVRVIQQNEFPGTQVQVLLIECAFLDGHPEHYALPLSFVSGSTAEQRIADTPQKVLALLQDETVLYDAAQMPDFQKALFEGLIGEVPFSKPFVVESMDSKDTLSDEMCKAATNARVLSGEQSNTSISYADKWLVKFFRKFETGAHPEVEMTEHLMRHQFNVSPLLSTMNLRAGKCDGVLAILTHYTAHQGDGWLFTLGEIARLFDRVIDTRSTQMQLPVNEAIGVTYPDRAAQLGKITAQMHGALAEPSDNASFSPLPFTSDDGRSLYQGMKANATRVLGELQRQLPSLPQEVQAIGETVLKSREEILQVYEKLLNANIRCPLIRVHGDFHLGQVLNTGQDFVVIDFEGEPRLSLSERRLRRPALRDVAGMIRSFGYAAATALQEVSEEDRETLQPWAEAWTDKVVESYLNAYLEEARGKSFIPEDCENTRLLLDLHILDKALYEIGYELNYRPHLAFIPLQAVVKQLKTLLGHRGSSNSLKNDILK